MVMRRKKTLFKVKNPTYTDLLLKCETYEEVLALKDKSSKIYYERVINVDTPWLSQFSNEEALWKAEEENEHYNKLRTDIEEILDEWEQTVFFMTYEGNHSLRSIANKVGWSHEWVRKVLRTANAKLKEQLPAEHVARYFMLTE